MDNPTVATSLVKVSPETECVFNPLSQYEGLVCRPGRFVDPEFDNLCVHNQQGCRDRMDCLGFSVFEVRDQDLINRVVDMIMATITDDLFIRPRDECRVAVESFVIAVARRYTKTSYHNFYHAVDVTQMAYMLSQQYLTANNEYELEHPFFLVVSALCHDIGHFGATNPWLHKRGLEETNEFVKEFGGEDAILEGFHVWLALKVINSCELFTSKYLREGVKDELIQELKYLVLWTDIGKNAKFVQEFEAAFPQGKRKSKSRGRKKMPRLAVAATLKLCDLANLFRSFKDSLLWIMMLHIERHAHPSVDVLDVDTFLKHQATYDASDTTAEITATGATLGFVKKIVAPLVDSYSVICKPAADVLKRRLDVSIRSMEYLVNPKNPR